MSQPGRDDRVDEILRFWFGELDDRELSTRRKVWFERSLETDQRIRDAFGDDVRRALAGELDGWAENPRSRLALVLLLDQFPRNIFRGSAQAFAGDARAQALALQGVSVAAAGAAGGGHALRPIERAFLYMPLMHSESLEVQRASVSAFAGLLSEASTECRWYFEEALDFARRHHDVIARFGRFPHRNVALARASTPEEVAFLEQPGSSF